MSGVDPNQQGGDGAEPHWRSRVSSQFHVRRLKPSQQSSLQTKLLSKSQAVLPIHVPQKLMEAKEQGKMRGGVTQAELTRQLRMVGKGGAVDTTTGMGRNEEEKEYANAEVAASAVASSSSSTSYSPSRTTNKQFSRSIVPTASSSSSSSSTTTTSHVPSSQSITYTLPPPSSEDLYKTTRTSYDELPLELFDNEELWGDLTPEEWISLGNEKYHGLGTPAKSSFYENKQYVWQSCRVLEYDMENQEYLIEFQNEHALIQGGSSAEPKLRKYVKRLSLLFEDEDADKFHARLAACRTLREEALAQRRYTSFLSAQTNSLYAPIQQSALHGIVGKLMMNSEELVMSRQRAVEELLVEVREDYGLAMKYAIIDYKRVVNGEEEEKKLAHLKLPPPSSVAPVIVADAKARNKSSSATARLPKPKRVPHLAVIPIPHRDISLARAIQLMEQHHYTHHPEATQVILALYRSWDQVKGGRFLDVGDYVDTTSSNNGSSTTTVTQSVSTMMDDLPMTLFEYQDHQDSHFSSMRERIQNDWRALVINLIRDNLNNVYKLFINDYEEFMGSELKRFLKMTGCMLRNQLASLIEESMSLYVKSLVSKYEKPLEQKQLEMNQRHNYPGSSAVNGGGEDYQMTNDDILEGYLTNSNSTSENTSGTGSRPLFVFKMSTSGSEVIFLPGLESIELTVLGLVNIPSKLQSICQIDNDVVPLLGMQDDALCSQTLCPELYKSADRYKAQLEVLIQDNMRQPLALKELYAPYSELLSVKTEEYVKKWFQQEEEGEDGEDGEEGENGEDGEKSNSNTSSTADTSSSANNNGNKPSTASSSNNNNKNQLLRDEDDDDLTDTKSKTRKGSSRGNRSNQAKGVPEITGSSSTDSNNHNNTHSTISPSNPTFTKLTPNLRRLVGTHTLQSTQDEIQKYYSAITEIQNKSPSEVTFKLIKIELTLLKEQLIQKAKEVANKLLEGLALNIRQQCENITSHFTVMLKKIKLKPTNVTELAELKSFSRQVELIEIPKLKEEIEFMQDKIKILMLFRYPITRTDFNLSWEVNRYPLHLIEGMQDTKLQIELDNSSFQKQLQDEQTKFQYDLEEYNKEVTSFMDFGLGTTAQMEQYASKVESLQEKLEKAEAQVTSFNQRDQLFGDIPMVYDELSEIKRKFKPYFELWSTTSLFNGSYSVWMTGPFVELDPVQIGKDIATWHKLMYKLEREFLSSGSGVEESKENKENKDVNGATVASAAPSTTTTIAAIKPARVATEMKAKIQEFKSNLPVITWLRNPGLRQRHWDKLSSILAPGRQAFLTPDADLTLSQILALDISVHKAAIEEISSTATKEYSLELQLDKMNREWKNVTLEIEPYKATGTYILKAAEDVLTLLDDHIIRTQAMRGSPYIKVWENRSKKWESKLQLVSSIMEEWLTCQKTWIYLEPIFSSEDIVRQMPTESRRFNVVDAYWRKTMEAGKKQGNIMDFVTDTDNLLKTFQESNKMLDLIGKHLNEYLETKRLAFPRFYFLSNDELLSILSETKNAQHVQSHLSKCFDGMYKLHFQEVGPVSASGEKREILTGMYSAEGEFVPFCETIDPNEGIRKGNVEIWLKEVERVMKDTLKTITTRQMIQYEKAKSREEWIIDPSLPGQVCLSVSQLYWTKQVTDSLRSKSGLQAYLGQLNSQLDRLVDLVRGELSVLARSTLGALTVLDVHSRDVVSKMIEEGVRSEKDFEWLSQMRYYWEGDNKIQLRENSGKSGVGGQQDDVPSGLLKVRMINTSMDYAYEYLGSTTRLVITPLTDRCYRTLMGAVHLHLGGAPEGPAGTGKTETVKDLSKAIAIQCVVFNCSDALNFRSMSKFFKGLAASGAWSCFDEFNRIELEVLSVIAQQISSIQRAIIEGKHTFFFDNINIPLIHTCSVFITMNPGYQGRSELPDNLKSLFRTVAMMIPDYALIAEIVLYSYGYSQARGLARKIVGCLRLSSEQLSSQDHYDFGMRNVKSTLLAAGALKSSMPHADEDWLIVQAVSSNNIPKFVSADIPLFNGIVRDLFPTVDMKGSERSQLLDAIHTTITQSLLQPQPSFISKCVELYDTFLVRHGLMLVGSTMAGKSTAIKTLQKSVTSLAGVGNMAEVNVHYLNPKSVQLNELYGADNPATTEWVDGILPVLMRSDKESGKKWKWIVFDGPVDAIWIENMNTCLDDNKKLCLASGEQIKLAPFMSLVFEVADLSQASPATVSRCGMVYMEPQALGIDVLVESWILTLHPVFTPYLAEIRTNFSWLIPPCLEFLRRHTKSMVPTSDMVLVSSMLKIFESLLDEAKVVMIKEKEREEARKAEEELGGGGAGVKVETTTKPNVAGSDASVAAASGTTPNPADPLSTTTNPVDDQYLDQPELRAQWIESMLIFSLIWSLGVSTDTDGRALFSNFLRDILNGASGHDDVLSYDRVQYGQRRPLAALPTPDDKKEPVADVFEFVYNRRVGSGQWVNWMSLETPYKIPDGSKFHEIIVPTIDTVRTNWMMELLITHQKHLLLTGATGTGKTIGATQKLLRGLDRSVYVPFMLAFSARTSAGQTQDIIDSKLDRRRTNVLGPPPNKKCVIFVDDLNLPTPDAYGAQPPIELLRQFMDYGGWYNRGRAMNCFTQIVDVQFVAAMGPPGGGRNPITSRYLRHYNNICLTPYDDTSLKRIFTTIMRWWLEPLPAKVRSQMKSLVDATVETYTIICHELLPTPNKSHYTFNLRDVSKVFQGIMNIDTEFLKEPLDLIRLWSHECTRVFCDRLIDRTDITWFETLIGQQIGQHFKCSLEEVFPPDEVTGAPSDRRQIFCDFSQPPTQKKRGYSEVRDMSELTKIVENYLQDYNSVEKTQMNLVLFTSAIDHISRISRILHQPYGNALLVGVGGSGRQSLTKLATFIADYDIFQIELTRSYSIADWKEDLRDILRKAGIRNRPMVFLITDAILSIRGDETFVEDLNSILNNGEVPNLFPSEDYLPIIEQVLPEARKAGKAESNASVFSFFVERCKANIHIVLCLSPVGGNGLFRQRLRQFPSLINCTTIDWFHSWSSEALIQVASRFLKDVNLETHVKDSIIEVCVDMQERVNELSTEYRTSLRRYNYVTPTSYLELIKLFRSLFENTRNTIKSQEARYRTGLEKIKETEIQVKSMQAQLEALRPQLLQSSQETIDLMKTIEQRTIQVAQTRKIVTEEEKQCNAQADAATRIKDECEEQLAEAMPALNMAMRALRVLKKSDLDELKSMKVPTNGVIITCEALCIMMGVQPKKVGEAGTTKKLDYWQPAKAQLFNDPQLFLKLQKYDKDAIPESIIEKVRPYVKNPDFTPTKVAKASKAAEGFCKWVLSMEVYDRVASQVLPKRNALAQAQVTLQAASEQLQAKKSQLQEVQDLLDDLQVQFELVNQKKKTLEAQVNECSDRLDRAEKLIGGLANEKGRWQERAQQLSLDFVNVVGNILVSSGVIAYLGVFTSSYRDLCVKHWVSLLQTKNLACDANFALNKVLGDPVAIRQWGIQLLPKDTCSVDSAIIAMNSRRYPLFIDPQGQANRWIKHLEDEKTTLKVIKQTDDQFLRTLSTCLQVGLPILIENINEYLDNILEPILLKQVYKSGARTMIRLGSEVLTFDQGFRLYMTTKLHNPHYPPETSTKVTLINFMITPEGLEDQMLQCVVSQEEPELEAERSELILKNAENQRQLQLIEDKILERLQDVKGQILDDQDLINTLQKSKQAAKLIEKRVAAAVKMEEDINKTRQSYAQVAYSTSNLFFCISDLGSVDPMYQFSLEYFNRLFITAIKDADKSLDVHVRTTNIEKQFMRSLYKNICRSLFEKDKLLFSFMLCLRILQGKNALDQVELRFLLTGAGATGAGIDKEYAMNPTGVEHGTAGTETATSSTLNTATASASSVAAAAAVAGALSGGEEEEEEDDDEEDEIDGIKKAVNASSSTSTDGSTTSSSASPSTERWLSDSNWHQIIHLSSLPAFTGFDAHFTTHLKKWRAFYESNDPVSRALPGDWDTKLSQFQKLLILRCFRPDRMTQAIQKVVSHILGASFITPPPFDLHAAYSDSDPCSPLIFILSPGVDPVKDVYKLAYELGFSTPDRLASISLGQGQGPLAESAIREAIDKGTWVLLQNAHLAVSWLPTLQKIVDEINPVTTNSDFRLWLTSMPSSDFPVSILQNGIKITNEPPRGIKANLAQTYRSIDQNYLDTSCRSRPEEHKKLLFSLAMFHAIVQERRKFGSMGYNISYEFTESDLSISKRQLREFLELYSDSAELPIKALRYLVGQLNYGGRVTDDWDRRTLTHILEDFFTPQIMDDEYRYSSSSEKYYALPAGSELVEYRSYIQDLPNHDDAEIFGLHENAQTTTAIKESHSMFETLLTLQPRTNVIGGQSREVTIAALARDIEAQLPPNFDIEAARRKNPVSYEESMNTVLVQELVRYNRLLVVVKRTLADLQRAIRGEVVMSSEFESMGDSMFNGQVPKLWTVVAYPSLKPLGAWVQDLKRRLQLFVDWLALGPPTVFWISGFFFTQSFLTGTLQNFARRNKIAIDEITFDFEVLPSIPNTARPAGVAQPSEGVYISGLFLEGARWDSQGGHLAEAYKRQLFSEMPVIWLRPCETKKLSTSRLTYTTPVYKTSRRAGTLSTTGHSTNFVLSIQLKSTQPEKHWVKRGVALLTQLDH